jgi:hypothetical protein
MRTAAVIVIGATPGLALGYVLLSAYLLSRIMPLPITTLPRASRRNPDSIARAA